MDSYQAQQPYMRPPLPPPPQQPPTSDPYHYQQQQQQQQQQPGPQWYSNQYQYPPHPPQWGPPPHADRLPPPGSYPPPPNPYPAHQQPIHPQYPPPPPPSRPHVPSHLPPPPALPPPHSYSQHTQEWGAAPSWSSNQRWDYPVVAHNNLEDLEAKAKAWANRQTTMENQHQQLQFPPPGRIEGQSHYHDQYPQSMDSHYSGTQHQSLSASSYPQVSVSGTSTHHPPGIHPQETSSMSSELSSYAHYAIRDGMPAGDTNAAFHHQGNLSASSSVHQQEVPSSYSSITGNEGTSAQDGKNHMQLSQPFAYGSQFVDPTTNLADQPLEFAPGFNSDHSPHMQSSYAYHDSHGTIRGAEPTTSVPTMNTWVTSVAPGVGYPPVHSLPSGPQHDPSMAMPSPIPGHAPTSFSSFPGLSLQTTIPSIGPPFALTGGTAAFPGDAYGVSPVSERPKKAAVPNWLREEIKKTVISSSSMDQPKEETQSIEGEGVDRSFGKGDQPNSKSIDSSRSTEDEDDEDQVEAARTAAINQEIKRILTEVLLKVTDELFDEIATIVLAEDDLTLEGQRNTPSSNHKVLSSPPKVSGPRASAKVLISAKSKVSEREDVVEKSRSISPGNVLGLANYATDDDEDDDGEGDDDVQRSAMPNSGKDGILSQSTVKMLSNDRHHATTNNRSLVEVEVHSRSKTVLASDLGKTNSLESRYNNTVAVSDISYNGHKNDESNVDKNLPEETAASRLKDTLSVLQPGLPKENVNPKETSKDDFHGRESRMEADKLDRHESKKNSVKDFNKEVESGKIRTDEKGDGKRRGQDERHSRKERTDDRNGSKEKVKEQSVKHGEKAQESESRKRSSHADVKEDRRETERLRRASAKEDVNRKREQTKDKEDDRSRHKHSTDSSRHKRRRSSDDSSDEASDDSKRKLHSRRRNLSPSPVRSRRRQVSRSPHSKHSQRRHSPYSSLDTNRGRRSRSRSPVRRQR